MPANTGIRKISALPLNTIIAVPKSSVTAKIILNAEPERLLQRAQKNR